ncbi:MAG: FtsX-like permease family protein [Bacteroidales bacterium]|nr:FtsX-like permease family protein [Bacteroidales bacterium]
MNLPLFIAGRYLFARKSHNVINVISAISVAGMAIGTAALIIILSVYNGFDDLIRQSLDRSDPDILITPSSGKVIDADEDLLEWLHSREGVISTGTYLQENVFASYEGRQSVVKARGIDDSNFYFGQIPVCAVSGSLAAGMEINPAFVAKLELFYPERDKPISMSNPMGSIKFVKVHPDAIFPDQSQKDNSLVLLPLACMRELLGYEREVSAIEVRTDCSARCLKRLMDDIAEHIGPSVEVSDRFGQNEALYKMMRYEKTAIFLILIFIIIIIAFNIFGCLSMLIIEKKEDIGTLYSLGATERFVRRTFILEGWLISLLGLSIGLAAGLTLSFIQQRFGLITIPGSLIVEAYPVRVKLADIAITTLGVASIGYLIALLPVSGCVSSGGKTKGVD